MLRRGRLLDILLKAIGNIEEESTLLKFPFLAGEKLFTPYGLICIYEPLIAGEKLFPTIDVTFI